MLVLFLLDKAPHPPPPTPPPPPCSENAVFSWSWEQEYLSNHTHKCSILIKSYYLETGPSIHWQAKFQIHLHSQHSNEQTHQPNEAHQHRLKTEYQHHSLHYRLQFQVKEFGGGGGGGERKRERERKEILYWNNLPGQVFSAVCVHTRRNPRGLQISLVLLVQSARPFRGLLRQPKCWHVRVNGHVISTAVGHKGHSSGCAPYQ